MGVIRCIFLTSIAAFAAFPAQAENSPAQHLLDSLQKISGAAGLSAAVAEDGVILWTGQSGFADASQMTPVTSHTRFRTASVSKLFAAALALDLAEEGRLDLDANIRTYVPDWPDHDGAVITMRQLAAHSSGISHYGPGDRYDTDADYATLNDSLAIYAHKPLRFSPGDDYSYSSYGYALMGAAIENITDSSFVENLSERITRPLSLAHTSAEDINALPADASRLYAQHGAEISRNDQHHVLGATGILSTPGDLVRFASAYMDGEIVNPEAVAMSLTPALLNNGEPVAADRFAVGFGWRIGENWEGEAVVHHAGITPGARSILTVNRERNIIAALVSNASWTSRIETTGEMIATAATEQASLKDVDCPAGDWNYGGTFVADPNGQPDGASAHGAFTVNHNDGVCFGAFAAQGALADWLRGLNTEPDQMRATLITQRPKGLVFAVATPWGAFPLYWENTGQPRLSGEFAGRAVRLRLQRIDN